MSARSKPFVVNTKPKNKKTPVENLMATQLDEAGLGGYERNVRFIPKRRFEADFYYPDLKLVLEVDGGVWLPKGGHTSGEGYSKDRSRDQLAFAHGIVTVRFTSTQVRSFQAITFLRAYIPHRRKEVELLSQDPSTFMGCASLLPAKFGT